MGNHFTNIPVKSKGKNETIEKSHDKNRACQKNLANGFIVTAAFYWNMLFVKHLVLRKSLGPRGSR